MTHLSLHLGLFELVKFLKVISFLFCVFLADFFTPFFKIFYCIL